MVKNTTCASLSGYAGRRLAPDEDGVCLRSEPGDEDRRGTTVRLWHTLRAEMESTEFGERKQDGAQEEVS